MKKLLVALSAVSIIFFMTGCAYFVREPSAQNIVKAYIEKSESGSDYESPSNYIGSVSAGAIISIVSSCYIYSGGYYEEYTNYSSGIVLNADGYILTSASVASVTTASAQYSASLVVGVLAPVYDDNTRYTLKEVDRDEQSGLAIYRFYDRFYYTDQAGVRQSGLQFTVHLSAVDVTTGSDCWAVGNSLGDLFSDPSSQTITGGIVSDCETDQDVFPLVYNGVSYSFMQTTVPTTPEMIGGGLFDKNGYLIGMFNSKIISETDGNYQYLEKSSLFYKTDILIDYVNTVSERLQTVIRLSVASKTPEEAAA